MASLDQNMSFGCRSALAAGYALGPGGSGRATGTGKVIATVAAVAPMITMLIVDRRAV
jgi:hypothetical protein